MYGYYWDVSPIFPVHTPLDVPEIVSYSVVILWLLCEAINSITDAENICSSIFDMEDDLYDWKMYDSYS